ncbi:MAG: flavin reductase [Firmicutes bacterium]|nr:flavin reductase [Bacillota bacterium]
MVSARDGDKTGAMTVAWGGIGYMWNKPVFYLVVRPQRHTKTILDAVDTFAVSFLKDEHHDKHKYFGAASGFREDKIKTSGMAVEYSHDAPYFVESKKVYVCKKMSAQYFDPACFLQKEHIEKLYPKQDYHMMYIGEILEIKVSE